MAFPVMILVVLLGKDAADFKLVCPAFLSLLGGSLVAGSALSGPRRARK